MFVSHRSLEDTSACLIPAMNAASDKLTANDPARWLGSVPALINQLRIMDPGKINEIGPVHPLYADRYTVRLVALGPTTTRIEFLVPSLNTLYVSTLFEPFLRSCV